MTQYYINQEKTHYLIEENIKKLPSSAQFDEKNLETIAQYIANSKILTPLEVVELSKKLNHLKKMLSPLRYIPRYSHKETCYSFSAGYNKSNIAVIKEVPMEQLSDSTPNKKINWSSYEKLQNLPHAFEEFLSVFRPSAQEFHNFSANFRIYNNKEKNISLRKAVKEIELFIEEFKQHIAPLQAKTYKIKKENYRLQDYEGSLENEKNFNVAAAYYLMGSYKGEEGFIGIDKTAHGSGDLYRFKIVKDLANAFIFHKDMSKELTSFKPLVRVDVEISFKGLKNPGTNKAAQKVQSFIDKTQLENAIAFITPQTPEETVPTKKKHKI